MPQEFSSLSNRCRTYVLGVSAIGLAVAGKSLYELFVLQVDVQWLILAALTLLTGTFTVRIPGITARLSVSDTFVFASSLLFGPAAGTITALLDALIISLRLGHHAREPFRVIFNGSAVALSTYVAAHVFFTVAGVAPFSIAPTSLGQILFPLFLLTLTYFLLNSWLVTFALALEEGRSPYPIWRDNFRWLAVNYFGGGSVAGLLVTYSREIDLITTLGIIVPLLAISYLTFKTSLGRIEDANEHLTQVNKMYLSTIETLAMAIDAKDQITAGHIRRVQRYAVGLAQKVGVTDDIQIKAIEAAALLHDMGKLAIPESILNKPGKLTENEFEVMKQHANIGADILSSIHFPYPVVPIVRHHHESWNGSGYPDGLKGVAIPIGARILSVVDCFDALTSDRPYRPRLSDSDAIAVLVQRRGSMYDPLVVDKFIEFQKELAEHAAQDDADKNAVDSMPTRLRFPADSAAQVPVETGGPLPIAALSLLSSIRPTPIGASIEDLGVIVSRQLLRLTNASSMALYCIEPNGQTIRCRYSDGPLDCVAQGPEIALGEKLSGWVAAHRTPIWNSDATLDLNREQCQEAGIGLASSVPLVDSDILVGVLTLYSPPGAEIAIERRLLVQSIAPLVAASVAASMAHDQLSSFDATTTSSRDSLYSVLDALMSHRTASDRSQPSALTVLLLSFPPGSPGSAHLAIQSDMIAAAKKKGHVVRLSASELLVIGTAEALASFRSGPVFPSRSSGSDYRRRTFRAKEIANSLALREVLGLTLPADTQSSGKPLIH